MNVKFQISKLIKSFTSIEMKLRVLLESLCLINIDGRPAKILLTQLATWVSCEKHQGVSRFKSLSGFFIRKRLGLEAVRPSYKIPRNFWFLYRESKKSSGHLIYFFSLLQFHRYVKLDPVMDTDSIRKPFQGSWWSFIRDFGKSLESSFQQFSIHAPKDWTIELKWFISESSGPNGKIAWKRWLEDWSAIDRDYRVKFSLHALYRALPIVNREEVESIISNIPKFCSGMKGKIHSRLVFLSDKGGKTRVVALGDLFSQSLLLPIHRRIFSSLRKIPMDGTFDQDKQRERVRLATKSERIISSIDLSSATDRFPAIFQAWVLYRSSILSFWQAVGWLFVMTNREFKSPVGSISYSVGQPMGMLSSWAAFALSHHFLVQACAIRSGKHGFTEYSLLGDDIVIFDPVVADSYRLALQHLGVEVSIEKSVCSKGVAEFAKSLFLFGNEVTGFPCALFDYKWDSVVTDSLSLLALLKRRKFNVNLPDLLRIYPPKEQVRLQAVWLSPANRYRSVLTGIPPVFPDNGVALETWLWAREVNRLDNPKDFQSLHILVTTDPTKLSFRLIKTPYLQFCEEGLEAYPRFYMSDQSRSAQVKLGSNWIAWDPDSWHEKPTIGKRGRLPSWRRQKDNRKAISDIVRFSKLLPYYLWPPCRGQTVR